MATSNGEGGDGQIWDGYSDYATVASRIGENVFNAIDAYARIHSAHIEGARIRPRDAAEARSRIQSASMSLKPELEVQQDSNDDVAAILARWEGGEDADTSVPPDGFLSAFDSISLVESDPDWLYQFVVDIRRAGWELGYLKAGRYEEDGPRELEPADVNELLES